MELFDSIIEKLKKYLVENYGFTHSGDGIEKTLSIEEYCMAPYVVMNIMSGKAYPGTDPYDTIESLLRDNYVAGTIMENVLEKIDFTKEERMYFECDEDGDDYDEEQAYYGFTEIESWLCFQNITVDREELMAFIASSLSASVV